MAPFQQLLALEEAYPEDPNGPFSLMFPSQANIHFFFNMFLPLLVNVIFFFDIYEFIVFVTFL